VLHVQARHNHTNTDNANSEAALCPPIAQRASTRPARAGRNGRFAIRCAILLRWSTVMVTYITGKGGWSPFNLQPARTLPQTNGEQCRWNSLVRHSHRRQYRKNWRAVPDVTGVISPVRGKLLFQFMRQRSNRSIAAQFDDFRVRVPFFDSHLAADQPL
jgi:hypothetical protein